MTIQNKEWTASLLENKLNTFDRKLRLTNVSILGRCRIGVFLFKALINNDLFLYDEKDFFPLHVKIVLKHLTWLQNPD